METTAQAVSGLEDNHVYYQFIWNQHDVWTD